MKRTIGILGLGIFGRSIARTLAEFDYDVIAVDKSEDNVNDLETLITKGVIGDITDRDLLETIGIGDCDAVVISTGTVLESSVLAVMHCKKLGVPKIIAKAKNAMYREVLQEIGASEVILPERESGVRLAKRLMRNKIEDMVELDDHTSIVEFSPPQKWIGKTIQELDLRNNYDINIIGMRETRHAKLNTNVSATTVVKEDIIFIGISESDIFERHDYLKEPYE